MVRGSIVRSADPADPASVPEWRIRDSGTWKRGACPRGRSSADSRCAHAARFGRRLLRLRSPDTILASKPRRGLILRIGDRRRGFTTWSSCRWRRCASHVGRAGRLLSEREEAKQRWPDCHPRRILPPDRPGGGFHGLALSRAARMSSIAEMSDPCHPQVAAPTENYAWSTACGCL